MKSIEISFKIFIYFIKLHFSHGIFTAAIQAISPHITKLFSGQNAMQNPSPAKETPQESYTMSEPEM